MLDRRMVLAGAAALVASQPVWAKESTSDSPVAHGVLAKNRLALAFEAAPDYLPDVTVVGLDGEHALADIIKGRTILMPLWAEWCAPCLTELPDFARLQEVYANDKFAIIPVLTGTRKMMTPALIAGLFDALRARALGPLIEKDHGGRLAVTMARRHDEFEIPCNLLIAPEGRVVGREFGIKADNDDGTMTGQPPPKDAMDRITRAASGQTQSLWGTPAGDEFAVCMANGFLT